MNYEVARSTVSASEWVVEAVGADGEVYVTIFAGPQAEARARGYAAFVKSDAVTVRRDER